MKFDCIAIEVIWLMRWMLIVGSMLQKSDRWSQNKITSIEPRVNDKKSKSGQFGMVYDRKAQNKNWLILL